MFVFVRVSFFWKEIATRTFMDQLTWEKEGLDVNPSSFFSFSA